MSSKREGHKIWNYNCSLAFSSIWKKNDPICYQSTKIPFFFQGTPCVLLGALSSKMFLQNMGIKHGFSCINIRQVPREVLKTEAGGRGFQHLPKDLANVNALKNHVRSLLLHKN